MHCERERIACYVLRHWLLPSSDLVGTEDWGQTGDIRYCAIAACGLRLAACGAFGQIAKAKAEIKQKASWFVDQGWLLLSVGVLRNA
jgi:hypothetical protein